MVHKTVGFGKDLDCCSPMLACRMVYIHIKQWSC